VTGNPNKLEEARRILDWRLETVRVDLPEIQSLDLAEVLAAKGEEAWRRVGRPLVVEETGLEVDAMGGFPGPLVRWMLETLGAEGIVRAARAFVPEGEAPAVTARCLLLYVDGERRVSGEGVARGTLVLPPRGAEGFGWDPVFLPQGGTRTFGELPGEVKDRIGHRGRAWRDLARKLG